MKQMKQMIWGDEIKHLGYYWVRRAEANRVVACYEAAVNYLRPSHLALEEDPWYSCWKAEGCVYEGKDYDPNRCTCGADFINEEADRILAGAAPAARVVPLWPRMFELERQILSLYYGLAGPPVTDTEKLAGALEVSREALLRRRLLGETRLYYERYLPMREGTVLLDARDAAVWAEKLAPTMDGLHKALVEDGLEAGGAP
jgi:hypothetical protein